MKDWLKLKQYSHFSPKFQPNQKEFIRKYVGNSSKISEHKFYPFIHFTACEKRYKRPIDKNGIRLKQREKKSKKREIFYANHLDSHIFAYYGSLITEKLQDIYLADVELDISVIAYRAIEMSEHRNKCNIDFAKEVFDAIVDSKGLEVVAICFDIKSFFDSLNHRILKKAWCRLFNSTTLDKDHFAVFKAITNYSFVEISDLIKEFPELKIKKLKYLKSKDIPSFCSDSIEFRNRVKNKGLIRLSQREKTIPKDERKGIPQGSPISAVLSNLYMLELDKMLTQEAASCGGMYRRYSDDLMFICSKENVEQIKSKLKCYIKDLKLIIQDEKTQEVHFVKKDVNSKWSVRTIENGIVYNGKPLAYLGFEFDGDKTRIKQKGVSGYYRKIKRLIKRKSRYAFYAKCHNEENKEAKAKDAWIYRTRIYRGKSHLGSKRKKVEGKVFWGNYFSYVKTASEVMKEKAITRQLRNHWKIIEAKIKYFEELYKLDKSPSRRKK